MASIELTPQDVVQQTEVPLVDGNHDYASITEQVCKITERATTPRAWYVAFAISSSLTLVLFALIGYLIETGDTTTSLRIRARYRHLSGDSERAVELLESIRSTNPEDWTEADDATLRRYRAAADSVQL